MTATFTPTSEQQRIIDHPLEPLRVAAGAGTGKTATVVERLASAIGHGLDPEAALGITFTNKAAEELADRLRRRLPELAGEGREVEVNTYHGFALRILTEFGALVGVERDLAVVGPGYVRQLLHESLGSEPYRHIDITALAHRIDDAAILGAQVAANLLDPGDIVAPDPADDTWRQRMELIRILVNYQDTKRRLGVVDFGDLIRLAYRVVLDHPDIAARIRARYRIVVLDEYQDTDPGQRRLLQAIFGGGFPITAVGDADQTIYEWRGASLDNFIGFIHHFPRAGDKLTKTLALTANRRSGPTILDVANGVKGLLHHGVTHDPLRPAAIFDDHVGYGWFRTAADEAAWIAGEMRRLHDEEHLAWRDMAVLFRRHRSIAPVRTALAAAEIPFEVVSLGGLIEVPEVADVHAWLRVLARPDDSVALTRILLGSRYRLGLGELAPLARWVRAHEPGRQDPDLEIPYPLLEAVDRWDQPYAPTTGADHALLEFRSTYRRLLADAQQTTLVELIRRIIDAIDGWTEVAAMPAVAGLTARLNLYRFLDLAEGWSPLAGRPSLEGFLGYLDLLADEATATELDTATIGGEDAVSLLTVHRAKGLEWDTVFIPALAKNVFPGKSFGFDDPRGRPRWLPYQLRIDADSLPSLSGTDNDVKDRLRERHRQGELRAAYVAVTRAKRRLAMTGAAWDRPMNPYDPSELLELVRRVDGTEQVTWVADPGNKPDALPLVQPVDGPDPHFGNGWRETLRHAVDHPGPPHP
ncbi:MAG: ATP-dependent helicase, partial [Actinomycetota bacterium]|nr:ATP-dependent helicase [Actinomycetota bacterium]